MNINIKVFVKYFARKSLAIGIKFIPLLLFIFLVTVTKRINNKRKGKTLLVLTPERFRGDIDSLIQTEEFNILSIDAKWLQKIFVIFYGENKIKNFFEIKNKQDFKKQEQFRKSLRKNLPIYSNFFNIDAVLSATVYYRWERDIGYVFQEKCAPWIAFHRENLFASKGFFKYAIESLYSNKGVWPGSSIVVHNKTTRDIMIKSGMALDDKVFSLGALRMDKFVKEIKKYRNQRTGKNKQVLMFSFAPGSSLYGYNIDPNGLNVTNLFWPKSKEKGMWEFFKNAHRDAIIATHNGRFDLIIRPKWGGRWLKEIMKIISDLKEEGFCVEHVKVDLDSDTHDLIYKANSVIGFASTAVLEAGLRKIPVIIPNFDEASDEKFSNYIILKEEYNAFDIANTRKEYMNMIVDYTKNYKISEEKYKGRFKSFERWVSKTDGVVINDYIKVLNNDISSWEPKSSL